MCMDAWPVRSLPYLNGCVCFSVVGGVRGKTGFGRFESPQNASSTVPPFAFSSRGDPMTACLCWGRFSGCGSIKIRGPAVSLSPGRLTLITVRIQLTIKLNGRFSTGNHFLVGGFLNPHRTLIPTISGPFNSHPTVKPEVQKRTFHFLRTLKPKNIRPQIPNIHSSKWKKMAVGPK